MEHSRVFELILILVMVNLIKFHKLQLFVPL